MPALRKAICRPGVFVDVGNVPAQVCLCSHALALAWQVLIARRVSDVELSRIKKQYEGVSRPVIPDLDLRVPSRKMVVLVGPSGCGKSTTLRMVAGLEEPTSGTIRIDGRDVTRVPPADRDIAMVFQSYALYPHMTVAENMGFALRIKKVAESEIKRRVGEAAESLGLTQYLARKPKALSGGQRQRVAIGRAVVRQPKVFLFDEPLSNLDAKLRGDMRREIARIHQQSKATGMYVTHDQIEAMTLGDLIVVLKDGVVQQMGSPIEIYETPANKFVAGFFGTPTMNFLPAKGEGFDLPLPASAASVERVTVGIRPERLSLTPQTGRVAIAGQVNVREVLGSEIVIYLESKAGPLTVRTDASTPARAGDTVQVWVDPASIHVFDGTTEARL
jgi:ABC-type sugar transport system ATPase subunit